MPTDRIQRLGNTLVQHGPLSDRVYLMSLDPGDCPGIVERIDELARSRGYSKIFAKIPADSEDLFLSAGYRREALVPHFFGKGSHGAFLGRYLSEARADESELGRVRRLLRLARSLADAGPQSTLPDEVSLEMLGPDRAEQAAGIFGQIFDSYPFPVHDPAYLRRTMGHGVVYVGAVRDGNLLGLASAEPDLDAGNAEMTDFAVLPSARGMSLARHLLRALETQMRGREVRTCYTIARAVSEGMNITFAREGYAFGGTLLNNTQIAGRIESMNVWHKRLP